MNKHRGSDFNDFLIEENLMTPTPRTDAAEILWNDTGWCVVPAEFARQLERELAAASDQLAANHEATNLMGKWLEQERALADRLAETLANVQGDYASTGAITTREVAESMAAWKEARSGTR